MPINLTTATLASTTQSVAAATYSFSADLPLDNRSKVAVVSTLGGTQTGVTTHAVGSPKQMIFKKPADFKLPSAYNSASGTYGKVPKNTHRIIFRGAAKVAANQWESLPINLDIGVPAGAPTFDRANVDACVLAFISGLVEMREELCQAIYDGLY